MKKEDIQKVKRNYGIVGSCDALDRAINVALQAARTDLSVLIVGESGVGKEVLPRIVHDHSVRRTKKYFAVNCGSIPEGTIDSELFGHEKGAFTGAIDAREGYFATANGGTLFLDEVGELPLSTQARLLRVLETGEYIRVGSSTVCKTDVRIVAATNVNLQKAISDGKFREDLYYRLNGIPVNMPPLRERGRDIEQLFLKFAYETADKYGMGDPVTLDEEAKRMLLAYPWPGNVRQLRNLTEQISILSPTKTITAEMLEEYIPSTPASRQLVALKKETHDDSHSFENEREILYKILFDLRNEVSELKKFVHSNMGMVTPSAVPTPTTSHPRVPFYEHVDYPIQDYPAAPHATVTTPTHIVTHGQQAAEADVIAPIDVVEEGMTLADIERQSIERALQHCHGRRRNAAKELGISERTLYRKINEYGLE